MGGGANVIDEVAKAIYESVGDDRIGLWDTRNDELKDYFRLQARKLLRDFRIERKTYS